jgi:hypothetical protein
MLSRLELKGFCMDESHLRVDGWITVPWSDSYVTRVT